MRRGAVGTRVVMLGGALTMLSGADATAQSVTRREVIRGRVTHDSGVAIRGATVIAVRAPDRAVLSATTDSAGRYEIEWEKGSGDYLVHVSAKDYEAARRRVMRSTGDTVAADFYLVRAGQAQLLAPVVSAARAPKPERERQTLGDPGAGPTFAGGVNGALPPDVAGDLASILST